MMRPTVVPQEAQVQQVLSSSSDGAPSGALHPSPALDASVALPAHSRSGPPRYVGQSRTDGAPVVDREQVGSCAQSVSAGLDVDFLFLNAKRLLYGGTKCAELTVMLQRRRFPALVGITEVAGVAGRTNLSLRLGPILCRHYNVYYSFRPLMTCDGQPRSRTGVHGGGVALLVAKRLCVDVQMLHIKCPEEDRRYLHGHLALFRLDPQGHRGAAAHAPHPYGLPGPLVVPICYAPPPDKSKWGFYARPIIFAALLEMSSMLRAMRQADPNLIVLMMDHLNLPDAGCSIPLDADRAQFPIDVIHAAIRRWSGSRKECGRLSLTGGLRVHRKTSKSSAAKSVAVLDEGTSVCLNLATGAGLVPLAGTCGHRQSTSWTACTQCRQSNVNVWRRKSAKFVCGRNSCGTMRACNDQVRISQECVVRFFLCPRGGDALLKYQSRRHWWSRAIDHTLNFGRFRFPAQPISPPSALLRAANDGAHLGGGKMPRRFRFSSVYTERTKEKKTIAKVMDNYYAALQPLEDEEADVDALNSYVKSGIAHAVSSVGSERGEPVDCPTVSSARVAFRMAQRNLQSLLSRESVIRKQGNREYRRFLSERAAAGKRLSDAQHKLESMVAMERARSASELRTTAKKEYWSVLDQGARVLTGNERQENPMTYLLEFQTDTFSVAGPRDVDVNKRKIWLERSEMYQVRTDLGRDCEDTIDRSLAYLSVVNMETARAGDEEGASLDPHSAACASALDPASPMAASDERRGVARDLDALVLSVRAQRDTWRLQGRLPEQRYAQEWDRLQRSFDEQEVSSVFLQLDDVGPGTDGLPPASLNAVQGVVVEQTTRLLNTVRLSGCIPREWYTHRVVLVYKGKGGDVHNLSSYRGIGIGALLLKVLSLLMLERLDEFVAATKALNPFQFGFRRQVGCPEAILTVTEAIRFTIQSGHVHLLFVDLKAAYDTVQRSILFYKCALLGITGRFLAMLMAIYAHAVAVVDMCGELSAPIPMEVGLLQGSVLSPILFNIAANDAIEALATLGTTHAAVGGPVGVLLPLVAKQGSSEFEFRASGREPDQRDFMPSAWFADDGVLMETRVGVLQLMVDCLASEFAKIGLLFNVPKTKWLVVAKADTPGCDVADHVIPRAVLDMQTHYRQNPIRVGNEPVELVSHFRYLGVQVSWRWNFASAWRESTKLARYEVHCMMNSGIHNWGVSLDALLDFVRAKVACHFHYVAAIAGGGGAPTAVQWVEADKIMASALRVMLGYRFADAASLRSETGTWPVQLRAKMLMLRFFCKILALPFAAPLYRAMCLSLNSLTDAQRTAPSTHDAGALRCHRQPWMQHVLAAMHDFGLPCLDPKALWHGLISITANLSGTGAGSFVPVPHPDFPPSPLVHATVVPDAVPLRLVTTGTASHVPEEEGVNFWTVPSELVPRARRRIVSSSPASVPPTTRICRVYRIWSDVLREACFVSLKRRANQYRQCEVQAHARAEADVWDARTQQAGTSVAKVLHASLLTVSREQPYLHLLAVDDARRMMLMRLGHAHVEMYDRSRARNARNGNPPVPRVELRVLRACYFCPPIRGVAGVYPAESLEHTLLRCKCPMLVQLRAAVRAGLLSIATHRDTRALCRTAGVLPPGLQGESDDELTALFTVLLLCTAVGPQPSGPVLSPVSDSAALAAPLRRAALLERARPAFVYRHQAAAEAARWVSVLLDDWVECIRTPREGVPPSSLPGCRLATLVAAHASAVFRARRKEIYSLNAHGDAYRRRVRDPPDPAPVLASQVA